MPVLTRPFADTSSDASDQNFAKISGGLLSASSHLVAAGRIPVTIYAGTVQRRDKQTDTALDIRVHPKAFPGFPTELQSDVRAEAIRLEALSEYKKHLKTFDQSEEMRLPKVGNEPFKQWPDIATPRSPSPELRRIMNQLASPRLSPPAHMQETQSLPTLQEKRVAPTSSLFRAITPDRSPVRSTTPVRSATPDRSLTPPRSTTPVRSLTQVRSTTPDRSVAPVRLTTPVRSVEPVRSVTPASSATPVRSMTPPPEKAPAQTLPLRVSTPPHLARADTVFTPPTPDEDRSRWEAMGIEPPLHQYVLESAPESPRPAQIGGVEGAGGGGGSGDSQGGVGHRDSQSEQHETGSFAGLSSVPVAPVAPEVSHDPIIFPGNNYSGIWAPQSHNQTEVATRPLHAVKAAVLPPTRSPPEFEEATDLLAALERLRIKSLGGRAGTRTIRLEQVSEQTEGSVVGTRLPGVSGYREILSGLAFPGGGGFSPKILREEQTIKAPSRHVAPDATMAGGGITTCNHHNCSKKLFILDRTAAVGYEPTPTAQIHTQTFSSNHEEPAFPDPVIAALSTPSGLKDLKKEDIDILKFLDDKFSKESIVIPPNAPGQSRSVANAPGQSLSVANAPSQPRSMAEVSRPCVFMEIPSPQGRSSVVSYQFRVEGVCKEGIGFRVGFKSAGGGSRNSEIFTVWTSLGKKLRTIWPGDVVSVLWVVDKFRSSQKSEIIIRVNGRRVCEGPAGRQDGVWLPHVELGGSGGILEKVQFLN